jgi:hypothetical protein
MLYKLFNNTGLPIQFEEEGRIRIDMTHTCKVCCHQFKRDKQTHAQTIESHYR